MSMLADSCAGTTRSRVTDRRDAYANIARVLRDTEQSEIKKSEARERLVTISLKIIDVPSNSPPIADRLA